MRFILMAVVSQSMAARPELGRLSTSGKSARLGEIISQLSTPDASLVALETATNAMNGILAEMSNATDHIEDEDAGLLRDVLKLVEETIFPSLDQSHAADLDAVNNAISRINQCNQDIAQRQSADGDLGRLHQWVKDDQVELDRLQGVVDMLRQINTTKWTVLDTHMQLISEPPVCPGLPVRTMPALDVYFEKSDYSIWFAAQQPAYNAKRDAFKAADSALEAGLQAYDVKKGVRDTQYCDWRNEFESACAAFNKCHSDASDDYTNTLVPRVTSDMSTRKQVKAAGATLLHQIRFLLADVTDQQPPPVDTSSYEIVFPPVPEKGDCQLSLLTSDMWNPPISCEPTQEQTCHVVHIGPNRAKGGFTAQEQIDTKKVGLPYPWMRCSNAPVNEQQQHWPDRFSAEVDGPFVTVKRVDDFDLWSQDLEIECCTFFNTATGWENVHVGPGLEGDLNQARQKVVHVGEGMQCGNLPINEQNPEWEDKFHTVVNGDKLLVKRVDTGGAAIWAQDLQIRCVRGPAPQDPQPQMVHVGASRSAAVTTVDLTGRGLSSCSATPVNRQYEIWPDEFEVTFDGSLLTVRRIDAEVGWAQNLFLECFP